MTFLAASLLTLSLLPAAALKAPAIPTPGPAPTAPAQSASVATRLPAEQRPRYELFTQKCSRCHGTDRALDAGFSADAWDAYLKKKYRRAGTGITAEQFAEIGAFLRYWASARR